MSHLRRMSIGKCKATICLKFIVVGGNIAGLAAAYAVRNAGHDVLVIEKSDGSRRNRGGLRSPPNMTKILNDWGLQIPLSKISEKCKLFSLHNGGTGKFIGSMNMNESFLSHLPGEFLFMQHSDLEELLYETARRSGVKFMYNTEVLDADSEEVSVILSTGEVLKADVIVGADGCDSVLRPVVAEDLEDVDGSQEKKIWINFVVPLDVLEADEEFQGLLDPSKWTLWLGSGFVITASLLAGGKQLAVSLLGNYTRPLNEGDEVWQTYSSFEEYKLEYSDMAPILKKLLKAATCLTSRVCRVRPHLDSLVCDQARICLVGEAAHPILPSGHHMSGMALEDAQTLGMLFSKVSRLDEIAPLLTAYEEIRQPRVSAVQVYEMKQQAMLSCPAGARMEKRDRILNETLVHPDWEKMDEKTFDMVWGNEIGICSHDATDQVEDWWTQWGAYFERTHTLPNRRSALDLAGKGKMVEK